MKYSATAGIVFCIAFVMSSCRKEASEVISGPPVVSSQNMLRAVSFPVATVGWAAGDSGRIYRSTDGGETWVPQVSHTADRTARIILH